MKKLFSLFAAFLFVGSMWATPETVFYESFGSTTSNTAYGSYNGFSAGNSQFARGTAKSNYTGSGKVGRSDISAANLSNGYTGASGLSGCYHGGTANTEATIIKISNIKISGFADLKLSFGALGGANAHKVNVTYIINEGSETSLISNGSLSSSAWTLKEADIPGTGDSLTIIIKHKPTNAWTIRLDDIKITGERTSTEPFISSEPSTVEVGEAETSSTIALTYTNITNYLADITLHPNADGTGEFSEDWLDAEIDDDDYATITYMVGANTGAARTAYIKVYATGDDDAEATLIIPVIQAAHVPVVTAATNNESFGSVTVSNNVITAAPEAGYRIDDDNPYTVTGTAEVNRGTGKNINKFTVTPSTDCTVTINFEAIPQYTVTWNNNGNQNVKTQVYEGSKPVFPATPSAFDETSNTFYGWATTSWNGKINDLAGKQIYRKASAMPVVEAAVEYFAVFAVEDATNSGWFETTIGSLTASDIFVLADQSNYAMTNDNGTGDAPDATKITVSAGEITSVVADNLQWNISGNSTDGYTFYPNESTSTWLYCSTTASSGSNDNMRVGTGNRKVFTLDASDVLMTKDDNTTRYVCRYSNSDYRGYVNKDNGEPIKPHVYKYVAPLYSDYITTEAGGETALDDVETSVKAVKVLRNGQLFIEKAGHIYNAMGQMIK